MTVSDILYFSTLLLNHFIFNFVFTAFSFFNAVDIQFSQLLIGHII